MGMKSSSRTWKSPGNEVGPLYSIQETTQEENIDYFMESARVRFLLTRFVICFNK